MKQVIITGASDGIGKALALAFARRKFRVGLIARRRELLEQVCRECRDAGSPQAELAVADVTDHAALRGAITDLERAIGGMGIFIANAGIDAPYDIREDAAEKIERVIQVNLIAAINGMEFAKARLLAHGGSGILAGVSSVAAARGVPGASGYAASKAGFFAYLESLEAELRPLGIQVTTIAPGFIDTPMTRRNRFPMPFLMRVDPAAEIFVRGMLSGKSQLIAPWPWKPIFWFLRALPSFIFRRGVSLLKFER
jgi:short-subunit dehydrogenase